MARLLTSWNPWREMERLQQEMGRWWPTRALMSQFAGREYPPVNLWQDEHRLVLTAEVPGISPENLDVTVTSGAVTIRAERPEVELADGQAWRLRERVNGPFDRTVELPSEVDPESATASYDDGILTLTLQRPAEHRPRKVAVKAG